MIAGGDKALGHAAEYSEDSSSSGRKDMAKRKPGKKDVVVGVAASGRTPYTLGALEIARKKRAKTVVVVCNRASEMGARADIEIVIDVGPEAVSGSTRMKAGSAPEDGLNLLTTGAMSRLGYIYGNLMVNVHTRNHKLMERGLNVLKKLLELTVQLHQKLLRRQKIR